MHTPGSRAASLKASLLINIEKGWSLFSSKITDPPAWLPGHTGPSPRRWAGRGRDHGSPRRCAIHQARREGVAGTPAGSGARGGGRRPPLLALGRPATARHRKYCLCDTGPRPLLPPSPPLPAPGHWGWFSADFLFWLYHVSLETGKPTHSLDSSSLPRPTARQTRI